MSSNAVNSNGKVLKRANPSTIQDKFMVGYQGWFTCAGDGKPIGPGHHGWLRWFNFPIPDGGRPNTDLWPDVSEYSSSELYPAPGLYYPSGEQAKLFSSRHPKTVQRHFHWMAQHAIDGAFLQRFAGQCDLQGGNEGIRNQRDEIGDRVREAAEKEGRVFAIMYDVSGVAPDRIQRILEQDWIHLLRNKGVLDSPNYLKEKGKPVISLWGFGFDNANHTPSIVRAITSFFRSVTPGGAYIIAGTPAHWRTSQSDADRNPEFLDVWLNEFDAISPWTVGRYANEDDADRFAEEKIKPDIELLKKRAEQGHKKVDYIPVILPGGSGYNLSEGKWSFNGIKRNGGKFLWKQIHNTRRLGVRVMYGAMWDEYDEGTAFMPVVQTKRQVPVSDKFHFMALDEDGFDLPSDWYMRICGFAAEGLRSERMIHETFPSKELQDYWSTRPHYEEEGEPFTSGSGSTASGGSGSGEGQAYENWLKTQKDDKDEPPPPPYSLEATEPEPEPEPEPVVQPTRTESILPASSQRTSSPVQTPPVVTQVQLQTAQVAPAIVQGPSYATQSQSSTTQDQPSTTPNQSNIDPLSRPVVTPLNTSSAPESVPLPPTTVHSVSVTTLAENFVRQSSLSSSSPMQPYQQQPSFSAGPIGACNSSPQGMPWVQPLTSPIASATGGYPQPGRLPQPFGAMPTVQSPLTQPISTYDSGPGPQSSIPQPSEGGYFPNVSQPQPSYHPYKPSPGSSPSPPQRPQPHQQYSHGPPPNLPQRPTQQSQANQQYTHGPPPASHSQGPVQQPQVNQQYSYGPAPTNHTQTPVQYPHPNQPYSHGQSTAPQAQWPPADWSVRTQTPPHPSHPQSPTYQGGFRPPPGTNPAQYNTGQQFSQPPTPAFQVPARPPSVPPNPYGGAPSVADYRPPLSSSSPKPQQQGPSFPMASGALDFALSAVGSVAGDERRKQLESGVGKLAQTGSKLYHKFSK